MSVHSVDSLGRYSRSSLQIKSNLGFQPVRTFNRQTARIIGEEAKERFGRSKIYYTVRRWEEGTVDYLVGDVWR